MHQGGYDKRLETSIQDQSVLAIVGIKADKSEFNILCIDGVHSFPGPFV